jgi:hypothetical protein
MVSGTFCEVQNLRIPLFHAGFVTFRKPLRLIQQMAVTPSRINKVMKTTKLILAVTLMSAVAVSAQARGFLGLSFGVSVPVPVVVAAPVVVAPAPVYVMPAPPVVVATPVCPGPDYVWAAGYWNTVNYHRVWVPGNWQYRPAHVVYGRQNYNRGWHRY